jgi:hopene-associated glycosyltransferase HpnB
MAIAFIILLCLLALLWTWLAISPARRRSFDTLLNSDTPFSEPAPGSGRITAIVPARNEADMLPRTIPSLCTADHPDLHVIVVDDQSDDASVQVLESLKRSHSNLTVVFGKPRPQGWTGKCWAVQQGVDAATPPPAADSDSPSPGEPLYLFTDADIVFHPLALQRGLQLMHVQNLDMLSLFPRPVFGQPVERLAMSGLVSMLSLMFPIGRVNDPTHPAALAAGGFILIRSSAYHRIGGHACVRGEMIEDVNLARRLKAAGMRIHCRHTRDLCTTRMYEGFADVWEGLAKNAYAGMEYQPHKFWVGLIIGLIAAVLPPLYLLAGLGWAWRTGSASAWMAISLALWINLCILHIHRRTIRHLRLPWYHSLLLPVSAALYSIIACFSAWQHHHGGGNAWKGRRYERKMLLSSLRTSESNA